jgi:hypothetical protein
MGANACTRQVLKQSGELLAAAYSSHVVNYVAGAAQTLTTASQNLNPPTYVQGINPNDNPAVDKDVKAIVDIDIGHSATVMVDYNIGYSTVRAFTNGVSNAPGPWEGSPFMLEILDWSIDTVATTAAGSPVYIVTPSTVAAPNPTFKLLPATGMSTTGQFTAHGRVQLGPFTPAADATYAMRKSFSLVWVYNTGDWNQGQGIPLDGYTIPALVNPFPTTLTDAPSNSLISFDLRYG